jgi:outer membrane protein assembly factor BamA
VRNILPLCHKEGRYKARLSSLSPPRPASSEACSDGVHITIGFEPGDRYAWSGIGWSGVNPETAAQLAASLGIAAGDPADVDRLDERLLALTADYRSRGFFAARLFTRSTVEEASKTVACRIDVLEGARYRFRKLDVEGLEADLQARVMARWTLAAGEYYDGNYVRRFMKEVREAEGAALAGRTTITIRERPETRGTTVDVVLEFSKPGVLP